jgi:2-keto-myo-inositol isomerase
MNHWVNQEEVNTERVCMMKISYNEATAKDCSTLEKDLVLCEKYGFDFIEIRDDMLLDYLQDHSVADLKNFFKNCRLKPHAMNALYVYSGMFDPKCADKDRDRALLADFLICCEVAAAIGSHYFIVVPDHTANWNTIPHPDPWKKVVEDSVRILTKLAGIAQRYNINLCWEPVGNPGFAVKNIEQAWEIVKTVNKDNVGLTLDSFNLYSWNKLNDFSAMRKVDVRKIFAVHVNNADDQPLGVLDHCHRRFCDQGEINLENFLGNLNEIGYDGMVSIETFRPEYWKMDAETVIAKAYQTTKALVDRITIKK